MKKKLVSLLTAAAITLGIGAYTINKHQLPGATAAVAKQSIDKDKLKYVKKACELSDEAMEHVVKNTKPGMTEKDLETMLNSYIKDRGYGLSFPTISVAGEGTSDIHGVPGKRKIKANDIIMIDEGAQYKGKEGPWCSDITRTYFVGEPTARWKEVYGIVKEAQSLALKKVKAGAVIHDVDFAARDYLRENSFLMPHALGHGVGRKIHEEPIISGGNYNKLKEGDIITIEPGVYLKGEGFGVRIEDTIVVTKDGYEYLTKADKF